MTELNATSASFATKLLYVASKQYGGPFCGMSSKNDQNIEDVRFWVSGVSVGTVGVAGLLWNLLSFVTIVTMHKKSLFHKLLITLTVFDMMFLMTGGLFMVQQSTMFNSSIFNLVFPKLIYPVAGISMTGSTYTCVAIALERYLGICFSQSNWYVRKSRFYVGAIIFLTLIIDGPRFLEIETTRDVNGAVSGFAYTKLRNDKTYVTVYTLWFRLIATAVVPFLLMLFCNVGIIFYYRKNSFSMMNSSRPQNTRSTLSEAAEASSHLRGRMSIGNVSNSQPPAASTSGRNSFSASQERTLYITFVCLTTTFLLCHLPRIILNVYEVPMSKRRFLCNMLFKMPFYSPSWVLVMSSVEKLTLIINSSINFVFYCLVGKAFRQQMCKVVLRSVGAVIGMAFKGQFTMQSFGSPLRHTLDYGQSIQRGDGAFNGPRSASVRGQLSVGQVRTRKRSNVSFMSENTWNSNTIKADKEVTKAVKPVQTSSSEESPMSVRIQQTLIKGSAAAISSCKSCPNFQEVIAAGRTRKYHMKRSMTNMDKTLMLSKKSFSGENKSTSTLLGVFDITIVIESNDGCGSGGTRGVKTSV